MIEKKDERKIEAKYESENVNFETYAKIKIQGTSSLAYEKKNYTITFYENGDYEKKQKIDVGKNWGEQNKYCLKANWIDKTHSRNIVSARITAKIQKKYGVFSNTVNNGVIDGFPIEVYNNNEFLGLYTLNIPKADWLWDLDTNNKNHMALVGDEWTNSVAFDEEITTFEEACWECEVGEENQETIDKFNRLIDFIKNSSDEEFIDNYEQFLDKDATIDYIIMLYAFIGKDNTGKNMIMVTYDGEIWHPSLYDLDATWGTWIDGNLCEVYYTIPDNAKSKLLTKTINCFSEEIARRWLELREDILSKENILKEFSDFIDAIPEETFEKERQKWGENIPGYGIEQIDDFLDYRLSYIDMLMSRRVKNYENKIRSKRVCCIIIGAVLTIYVMLIIYYLKDRRRK